MKRKDVSTMKYTSLLLADYCDGCREVNIDSNCVLNEQGVRVIMLTCKKEHLCENLYNEIKRKENGEGVKREIIL